MTAVAAGFGGTVWRMLDRHGPALRCVAASCRNRAVAERRDGPRRGPRRWRPFCLDHLERPVVTLRNGSVAIQWRLDDEVS